MKDQKAKKFFANKFEYGIVTGQIFRCPCDKFRVVCMKN